MVGESQKMQQQIQSNKKCESTVAPQQQQAFSGAEERLDTHTSKEGEAGYSLNTEVWKHMNTGFSGGQNIVRNIVLGADRSFLGM
jgi:hypothetical protein